MIEEIAKATCATELFHTSPCGASVVEGETTAEESVDEKQSFDVESLYDRLRSQIENEDGLCNNRMTWLNFLQAFLFGAFGFSTINFDVSHQGLGEVEIQGRLSDSNIAYLARDCFAVVGTISSLLVLVALWAAVRSINNLVDRWHQDCRQGHKNVPQIIGNHSPDRSRGTYLGQTPLFGIPVLYIIAWQYVGLSLNYLGYLKMLSISISFVAFATGLLLVAYYLGDAKNGKNIKDRLNRLLSIFKLIRIKWT